MNKAFSLAALLVAILLIAGCGPSTPKCTMKYEWGSGWEMVNTDCQGCTHVSQIGPDGKTTKISIDSAMAIVKTRPPSSGGIVDGNNMSDMLMYYFLFNALSPTQVNNYFPGPAYSSYRGHYDSYRTNKGYYKAASTNRYRPDRSTTPAAYKQAFGDKVVKSQPRASSYSSKNGNSYGTGSGYKSSKGNGSSYGKSVSRATSIRRSTRSSGRRR